MKNLSVFIVPHSHWDREWYQPFEVFRKKLIDMLNRLLDIMEKEETFLFVLDGQSVLIEDYLEILPGRRPLVEKYVRQGRLILGPWYTLPDEFLVSGESLVRNLLIGHRTSRALGAVMEIGYAPDSFGHAAQMPQILSGFGIRHFIFTRGLGDQSRSTEYIWKGSDGTEILSTCQVFAYNNAGYLPDDADSAAERIIHEVERLKPFLTSSCVLLNNGGDHHWPHRVLIDAVSILEQRGVFRSIEIASFADYHEALQSHQDLHVPELAGELRDSRYYPVLSGVLSSRMNLKKENHVAETLLQKWAEPFSTIAMKYGKDYPYEILNHTWKTLLQNHSHDSICGCCIDEVHLENLVRFEKVRGLAMLLKQESLAYMASQISTGGDEGQTAFVVFNPLNCRRREPVTFSVTRENGQAVAFLMDSARNRMDVQMKKERAREGMFPHPSRKGLTEREYVFMADVPPMGYAVYTLQEHDQERSEPAPVQGASIENEYYRITWDPLSHITLHDIKRNITLTGISEFIDEADCGDEYNFSPLADDSPLQWPVEDLSASIVTSGPLQKTLQISGSLILPSGLSRDRNSRASEKVMSPFTIRITLYDGINRVDFSLFLENRAKDHRLRICFPSGMSDPEFFTGAPFDLQKRDLQKCAGTEWIERPSAAQPQKTLAFLKDNSHGIALFSCGLPEIEMIRKKPDYHMSVTLFRSVGWLSRQDIAGRSVEAGPKVPTPGAQNLASMNFRYAIALLSKEERELIQKALCFDVPLEGVLTEVHGGSLPARAGFIELTPHDLIITAVKKAEISDNIIVRFYNPTMIELEWTLRTVMPLAGYYIVSLNEERTGGLLPPDHLNTAGPGRIITLELVTQSELWQERQT